jgi:hypothetical protein
MQVLRNPPIVAVVCCFIAAARATFQGIDFPVSPILSPRFPVV